MPDSLPPDSAWFTDPGLAAGVAGNPRPRHALPGEVLVITRSEIERIRAQTPGGLFHWLASAQIIETGYLADQSYITHRGASPQEIVFLVDGDRTGEPVTDLMDLREIPLESISRVEVIQGPQASILAGEATEAVVNLVTSRHSGGAARSRISIVDGDGGATIVRGRFSRHLFPRGFVSLSATRTSVDGLTGFEPSSSTQTAGRTALELAGTRIEGWLSRTALEKENESGIETGSHEYLGYGFSAGRELGDDWDLEGKFSRITREFLGEYDFPVEDAETGRISFDVALTRRFGPDALVKGGVEGWRERVDYRDGGGYSMLRGSVYGLGTFVTDSLLSVLVGGRVDLYRDHDPKSTAAASVRLLAHDRVRPYAAAAAGTRVSRMGAFEEENLSFEAGTDIDLGSSLSTTLSWFWRDGGKDIPPSEPEHDFFTTSPATGRRRALRATARYRTAELLSLRFDYTRWKSDTVLLDAGAPAGVPSSHSVISLSAFLEKTWKDGNLGLEGAGLAKYLSAGEAVLVDVKLGVRIIDLELFYHARNLLEEVYEPLEGVPAPGHAALWGFSWRFLD